MERCRILVLGKKMNACTWRDGEYLYTEKWILPAGEVENTCTWSDREYLNLEKWRILIHGEV